MGDRGELGTTRELAHGVVSGSCLVLSPSNYTESKISPQNGNYDEVGL